MEQKMEEYAIVIDYMPEGRPLDYKHEPVVQAVGTEYFTTLELIPKKDIKLTINEQIYIGKDEREKIQYIKGRINYDQLTNNAKSELPVILKKLVLEQEDKFVDFMNKSGSLTLRKHQLELIPGVGKKHMLQILNEREKKPFKDFKDIMERISLMPDPQKIFPDRIIEELMGNTKYHLFTRPKKR
ncbi:MAG: DUF655 domain-containing protein [Candidatus Diapherotrites archaeon]|nr:DUF655 domain-containing protein [Candidatus Diapherotrites archaeon]